MRRVGQGEERRRAAVLQDTISIAVADFGFFCRGLVVRGVPVGEKNHVAPLGNPFFLENVGTVLGPKIC